MEMLRRFLIQYGRYIRACSYHVFSLLLPLLSVPSDLWYSKQLTVFEESQQGGTWHSIRSLQLLCIPRYMLRAGLLLASACCWLDAL